MSTQNVHDLTQLQKRYRHIQQYVHNTSRKYIHRLKSYTRAMNFSCRMESESIFMFCCIYYPAHIPGEEKLLYHEFQHKTLNVNSLEW